MRAVVLTALILAACGVQTRDPDITGQVTRVTGSNGRFVLLVEDSPGQLLGRKMSVTVDGNTKVFRDSADGKLDAQPDELASATLVSVWMGGNMKADIVLIRASRAPTVPLRPRSP
jgi:hypothetical protein